MYLDSAIIIKLLVAEPDFTFFQNALVGELLCTSELSITDVALRSLDAIHLAACNQATAFPLCATDCRMRAAATKLHIPIFPESLPS